jgi:hypothetical protein
MNREEAKQKILRLKQEKLKKQKAEQEKRARIFSQWPGKALKILSLIVAAVSLLFVIDGFLSPKFKSYKIRGAKSEIYDVMSQDGWGIHAKYFHVYLDDQKDFEVFIYMYEYYIAKATNTVEIGFSPIFHIPRRFRVSAENLVVDKPLEFDAGLLRYFPIFLLVLSLTCYFMNFKYNSQTVAFGHINFVAMPVALIVLLIFTFNGYFPSGQYTMDISELHPKDVDRMNAVKALSGEDDSH